VPQGLDLGAGARSHVWAFIEKFKRNRVIVLTTHSMEEADILGDQIAIMALGKLRCGRGRGRGRAPLRC